MKKIIFFFLSTFLLANSYSLIKNILGEETFNKYENLIQSSIEKNASLKDTLIFLKGSGLINLYFNKIKTIHPTFVFINNNPIFNTKTLYSTLTEIGYYNFYPIKIIKNHNYTITLEITSQNYIDPLVLLNQLNIKGCVLFNIKKEQNFTYYISCNKEKLINTASLKENTQILHNINGIYWIKTNGFKKIEISTSKYDFWHPYIVFYDTNLNILNIISTSNLLRKKILNIPQKCKYIKVTDSFTKENVKRGLFIKGLK